MFCLHISMCIHTPLVQLGRVKGAPQVLHKEKLLSSSCAAVEAKRVSWVTIAGKTQNFPAQSKRHKTPAVF